MRATFMWTFHDLPAYGDMSGWNTKGALAGPSCNYGTHSRWLKHGGKYCFMGHRRFLDKDNKFRKDRISFDGSQEMEVTPRMLSGQEVMMYTEHLECKSGKSKDNVKKPRNKQTNGHEKEPWTKRSIFADLPYYPDLLLRNNLDVMHIGKNVIDNVIGTLLNMDGKTKDNLKACLDLVEWEIRYELHPQMLGSNKTYLPPACFSMTPKEKDDFLKVLKRVKVPDGYSSNLSRCIQLKQRKIIGMKSHDCHILMLQLLPIALRGSLPKKVVFPLIELSCYFIAICSKVLDVEELERLESQIAVTLCNLEKNFPPSFFTVMVHLVVHLTTEAKLAGPVHYRWMYPIERYDMLSYIHLYSFHHLQLVNYVNMLIHRYLHHLKSYVRNKACPEGSIVEGYIAEECLTFCSRYLDTVETVFNRPPRNVEGSTGLISHFELDQKSWMQAHRYVLFNTDEITPFRVEHKEHIKRQSHPRRLTDEAINRIHSEKFCDWFRSYVGVMDDTKKQQLADKIKWLAQGPNTEA
ncbi:uncharacterized protein LOC131322874 isoform X1 [Rhododendron vialii]|uniref:uncharacterized protein LOC131322874 isoform X1 n=1 Tax=Rhododendron vialii TaxID=182163 RepID=UPI00265E1F34|nr:uncharacterized protein LOC131322874 isoform X1 [Rhododendron vialii]